MAVPESRPGRRLCLYCDNRHGCKSPLPPCQRLERTADEARLPGRERMGRRGLLHLCQTCPDMPWCWGAESLHRALQLQTTEEPKEPTDP